MKKKRFMGCLLIICALFFSIVLWTLAARIHWWLGGRINNAQIPHEQNLNLSGDYLAEIKSTRLFTANMEHPFLPDNLHFTNAHVTIAQFGRTNITVISESLSGDAVTNSIVINGWRWRWESKRLEFANTTIGPGLGLGVFPGIVKFKSRCNVEVIQTNCNEQLTLRVKILNQHGGVMLPFGFWSDPDDSSEVILTPTNTLVTNVCLGGAAP